MNSRATSANDTALSADIPSEEIALAFEAVSVRLWRAVGLERFVDTTALLQSDAPPEPPYWMHVWPGAMAAARRTAQSDAVRPGTRVLELGCGLGLPALVAAQRGATAVASDRLLAPLHFVRRSAAATGCALGAVQMDWGAPAVRGAFDVCVGADVGYDAAAEADLVAALTHVLAPHGVIWLADSVNTARDGVARRLATAGFAVAVSSVREWEDGRPVWVRMIEARRA